MWHPQPRAPQGEATEATEFRRLFPSRWESSQIKMLLLTRLNPQWAWSNLGELSEPPSELCSTNYDSVCHHLGCIGDASAGFELWMQSLWNTCGFPLSEKDALQIAHFLDASEYHRWMQPLGVGAFGVTALLLKNAQQCLGWYWGFESFLNSGTIQHHFSSLLVIPSGSSDASLQFHWIRLHGDLGGLLPLTLGTWWRVSLFMSTGWDCPYTHVLPKVHCNGLDV